MLKNANKNGPDHATSGPLLISASSFDLLAAHLLTPLSIAGQCCSLSRHNTNVMLMIVVSLIERLPKLRRRKLGFCLK